MQQHTHICKAQQQSVHSILHTFVWRNTTQWYNKSLPDYWLTHTTSYQTNNSVLPVSLASVQRLTDIPALYLWFNLCFDTCKAVVIKNTQLYNHSVLTVWVIYLKNGKPSGSIAYMGKIAASVLLKLFINGNEKCYSIDATGFRYRCV